MDGTSLLGPAVLQNSRERERKKHHNQAAAPEPVSSPGEKAGNETRLRSRSAMRD